MPTVKFFLVNPNGLFFTETAVVDVGGIVARGLNINSEAFLNGSAFLNHEQNTDGFAINNGVVTTYVNTYKLLDISLVTKSLI